MSRPEDSDQARTNPEIAAVAVQHVELAMNTIVGIMRRPGRGASAQLAAARLLLEIAAAVPPLAQQQPVVSLADARAASAELLRRRMMTERQQGPHEE